MKKIFLVFALAFAFTTGMAAVTVVAQMDQAQASDAAVPIAYPAWNGCGNCALRGVSSLSARGCDPSTLRFRKC